VYQSVFDSDPPHLYLEEIFLKERQEDYYLRMLFKIRAKDERCPAKLIRFKHRIDREEWSEYSREAEREVVFLGREQHLFSIIGTDESGNESSPITCSMEFVKEEGGRVVRSHDGEVVIFIPTGALSQDGVIIITEVDTEFIGLNDAKPVSCYDIMSDIQLRKRISITIRYDEEFLGEALCVYKEKIGGWERIGGTVDGGKIAFPTDSFGRFAIMCGGEGGAKAPLSLYLDCQPRAFSPKRGEKLIISFSLDVSTPVTIKIYNLAGRLIRVIANEKYYNSGENCEVWNGEDEDREIVPSGLYICTIEERKNVRQKVFSVLGE
jgi:hypothetical protein